MSETNITYTAPGETAFTFTGNRMKYSMNPNKNESGTKIISYTWKFDIVGIINNVSTSTFNLDLQEANRKLNKPGGVFEITAFNAPNPVMFSFGPDGGKRIGGTGVAKDGDAIDNGPFASSNGIEDSIIGEMFAQVTWSVEITVKNFENSVLSDENIVDFSWNASHSIDPDGSQSRNISGQLQVVYPECADNYRGSVIKTFPALSGFKRKLDFVVSASKTILEFTITDEEMKVVLPPDIIDLSGTFRVAIVKEKAVPRLARSLSGSVRGKRKPGIKNILLDFVSKLILQRFKGVPFIYLETNEVTENLVDDEIQFSISSNELIAKDKQPVLFQELNKGVGALPGTTGAIFASRSAELGKGFFNKPTPDGAVGKITPKTYGDAGLTACEAETGSGKPSKGKPSFGEKLAPGQILHPVTDPIIGEFPGYVLSNDIEEGIEIFLYTTDENKIKMKFKKQKTPGIYKQTRDIDVFLLQMGAAASPTKIPKVPKPVLKANEEMLKKKTWLETRVINGQIINIISWRYKLDIGTEPSELHRPKE